MIGSDRVIRVLLHDVPDGGQQPNETTTDQQQLHPEQAHRAGQTIYRIRPVDLGSEANPARSSQGVTDGCTGPLRVQRERK